MLNYRQTKHMVTQHALKVIQQLCCTLFSIAFLRFRFVHS